MISEKTERKTHSSVHMKGRAGGGGVGGVQTSPSNLPTRSLTDMRPELNPESQRFEARRRPQLFPLPTSEVLTEAFTFISSPGVALMETENLWERARLCVCVCVCVWRWSAPRQQEQNANIGGGCTAQGAHLLPA